MDYKKKVIIIFSLLILGVILAATIFILIVRQNNTPAPLPNTYSVSVFEKDGSYRAQAQLANGTIGLTDANINTYLIVSFNGTHDIMSLICPKGYLNSASTSAQNINIERDPALGSSIQINPNQEEDISITCTKQ